MTFARRASTALAFVLVACAAQSALAQGGLDRTLLYLVKGEVRDEFGDPIKGATVTALNDSQGTTFTGTTDSKGRFVMIGLRPGLWRMIAQAPGHAPMAGQQRLRSANNPIILFTLETRGPRPDGPLANVSAKTLQSDLSAAERLFANEQWDQAIAAYRELMRQSPSLSAIQLQIAAAFRNKQQPAEAEATYQLLLASEPSNERARVGLAELALERNDLPAAEEVLRPAAEKADAGAELLLALGQVKARAGDLDAARQLFDRAERADPSWGRPVYELGALALRQGDQTAAAILLERVESVAPDSAEAIQARSLLSELK